MNKETLLYYLDQTRQFLVRFLTISFKCTKLLFYIATNNENGAYTVLDNIFRP